LRQYSVNNPLALEREEKRHARRSKVAWLPKLVCIVATLVAPFFFNGSFLHAQEPTGDSQANLAAQNEAFELEVIRLVNVERTSRGLHPLARNSSLTESARAHNQDMILNHFFDHTGSNGSSPAQRACAHGYAPYGWGECFVGENIAAGYSTPAEVMQGWMNSSGHQANILKPEYREIGMGHATGGDYEDYWTMDLGAQPNVLPAFINDDAVETPSCQVAISLTKEDVSSWGSIGPITGVQISENPSFSGAAWQSWSQHIPFTLTPGNGTKTVYVRFKDQDNRTVSSNDSILLNEPMPRLSIGQDTLVFLSELGSGQTVPVSLAMDIQNGGADILHWTASDNRDWLVLASGSGDAPAKVNVWVNNSTGVLNSLGTKTATITVSATNPNALDTPQSINVIIHVVEHLDASYLPLILH
jgi:uncharacterized protein YkwD